MANQSVIVRRLFANVIEVQPTYPNEPVLRLVEDLGNGTADVYRISCSDEHNDRIIQALMGLNKDKTGG